MEADFYRMMILANVGTPLMLASFSWLALGNLFIGIVEGWIVVRATKSDSLKPYLLMIAANYFSAWIGFLALGEMQPWLDRWLTVETLLPGLAVLMLAAWAWSVVLEFPFVWFAFSVELRRRRWLPWRATLIAQTVSYAGLVFWLGSCSSLSLVTSTQNATARDLVAGHGATVYYLTPDGTELRRIRLDGTNGALVAKTSGVNAHPFGFPTLNIRQGADGYSVVMMRHGQDALLLGRPESSPWLPLYAESEPGSHFDAVALPGSGDYTVVRGFWAIEGLQIKHADVSIRLAVEMPFAQWYVLSPTVMRGGLVVFEAGKQVLLYDTPTGRLAPLVRGCLPLVIPDEAPAEGFHFPKEKQPGFTK